jgi:hypothetical protein
MATGKDCHMLPHSKYPYVDEAKLRYVTPEGIICLDEVQESIAMPKFDAEIMRIVNDHEYVRSVELKDEVLADLRHYVTLIAGSYNDNPFHNFEHACHVTMYVLQLRLSAPVTGTFLTPTSFSFSFLILPGL